MPDAGMISSIPRIMRNAALAITSMTVTNTEVLQQSLLLVRSETVAAPGVLISRALLATR